MLLPARGRLLPKIQRASAATLGALRKPQFRFPQWWAKLSSTRQAIRAAIGAPIRALGAETAGKATMARHIDTIARLFAPLIVGAALVGAAQAQDCPRGDLD